MEGKKEGGIFDSVVTNYFTGFGKETAESICHSSFVNKRF